MGGLLKSIAVPFLQCCFLYHVVAGLKCLSCSNVIQPRHCHYIRECQHGDTCGVIKYVTVSNDIRYDVGCFTAEDCKQSTRKGLRELTDNHQYKEGIDSVLCRQCCNSSLCHHNGCGEIGFPEDRGLMCYTCKQSTDPTKCEHFSICHKDQICHLGATEEFGDNIFTSSCQHKTVCQGPSAIIFGRRRQRPLDCNRCCSSDLCNDKCQDSTPTTTTTEQPTSTPKSTSKLSSTATTPKSTLPSTSTAPTSTLTSTSTAPTLTLTSTSTSRMTSHGAVPYMKSSTSTEFVLMFQNNEHNSDTHYSILVAAKEVCNLSIYVPAIPLNTNRSLTVGPNYIDFNMNSKITPNSGYIENKAIYLKSDKPISVFGLNRRHPNSEAYLALPLEYLGVAYRIVNLQPTVYTSLFMIAATQIRTTVTITLNSSSPVVVNGKTYSDRHTIRLNMDNLDTLEISSASDLTGTDVNSDKPVAVTSGNMCTRVYNNQDGSCAPIVEFLIPVSDWGQKFVVPALGPAIRFYIKIVASSDYTRIVVSNGISNDTYMAQANRHLELSRDSLPVYIESNRPIYVGLITQQTANMSAVFVNIPAISQFTNAYQISTPLDRSATRTVTVMIESRKKNGLLFNDSNVNFQTISSINTPVGEMSIVTINMNGSYTEVTHGEKGVKFGVLVHGTFAFFRYRPAYAYPGGLSLRNPHNYK